jgi:hypothetical protein
MARTFADDVADGRALHPHWQGRQGMWVITDSAAHGVEMAFRRNGVEDNIVLMSSPCLTHEQWGLIRQQFENMGIAPRLVRDPS